MRWNLCKHGGKATLTLEILSALLCFLVALGQHVYLNYLLITTPATYAFLAGDIIVAICMLVAVGHTILFWRQTHKGRQTRYGLNLKFGYVVWLLYSSLTSAKIIFAAYKLPNNVTLNQAYRLSLCLSAMVFLLLVMSYHFHQVDHHLQTYLSFLVSTVTLDICDSVQILDLLYQPHLIKVISTVKIVTLVLVTINFVLPTAALFDLQLREFPFTRLPWDKLYSLSYILVVNVPYLCLRLYIWATDNHPQTITTPESGVIFLVKNVIMIIVATRDIWMSCLYQPDNLQPPTSTHTSQTTIDQQPKITHEMMEIDQLHRDTSQNSVGREPLESF